MLKLLSRAPLAIALLWILGACSKEPVPPKAEVQPAASPAAAAVAEAPEAAPSSAYERAVQQLIEGAATGLHFESAATLATGKGQKASGIAQGRKYSFSVTSTPDADPAFDGAWMSLNGFFQKESANGFAKTYVAPAAMTLFLESLPFLPTVESALRGERAPVESVGGISCQPYSVDLPAQQTPVSRYSELGVCVDEASARVVKLQGATFAGESFSVSFSEQGEPVQMPQAEVFDWTKEFPVAEPGSAVPVKQFENCPDLIKMTPEGCEGYISAAPKAATEPDPAHKSD